VAAPRPASIRRASHNPHLRQGGWGALQRLPRRDWRQVRCSCTCRGHGLALDSKMQQRTRRGPAGLGEPRTSWADRGKRRPAACAAKASPSTSPAALSEIKIRSPRPEAEPSELRVMASFWVGYWVPLIVCWLLCLPNCRSACLFPCLFVDGLVAWLVGWSIRGWGGRFLGSWVGWLFACLLAGLLACLLD
jgi:hypothetical protein